MKNHVLLAHNIDDTRYIHKIIASTSSKKFYLYVDYLRLKDKATLKVINTRKAFCPQQKAF